MALDAALSTLPDGPVREAADMALESVALRLLELMTDRLVVTTRPTMAPPPDLEPHECLAVGDGGLQFCGTCGRGLPEEDDGPASHSRSTH